MAEYDVGLSAFVEEVLEVKGDVLEQQSFLSRVARAA